MRVVTSPRTPCIVALFVAICVEVEHVNGAKADLCAGGRGGWPIRDAGVVKASRSASLGARILTRCGRSMVLKYTLSPKQFYRDMDEFRRKITKCYMDYSKWFVHARPDVVGEDIGKDVEELTAAIENCLITQMPKDQDTMLGIIRYIRTFFFTA